MTASFPTPEGPDKITSRGGCRPPKMEGLLPIPPCPCRHHSFRTARDPAGQGIGTQGRQDNVAAVKYEHGSGLPPAGHVYAHAFPPSLLHQALYGRGIRAGDCQHTLRCKDIAETYMHQV